MARVAGVRRAGGAGGQPADSHEPPATAELREKPERIAHLDRGRTTVRRRRARMRRYDVPAERVKFELLQRPVDDRRARLRRAAPGQLALGREREPRHARTPIAGRFTDE